MSSAVTSCFTAPEVTIVAQTIKCGPFSLRGVLRQMTLLILESLGSTEFLFILIMALVFFGPRKLPQISRSLGKNLADFRRASEEFKTTWHREVSLEEFNILEDNNDVPRRPQAPARPAAADDEMLQVPAPSASIETTTPDSVIPRQATDPAGGHVADQQETPDDSDTGSASNPVDYSRKRDWL
ncbi:MAG: twin-arginine translocase TatA/TatE family subunit [Pyrinomonadaceae bacterium]